MLFTPASKRNQTLKRKSRGGFRHTTLGIILFVVVFSCVHATLYVTILVGSSIRPSVGPSVGRSVGRLVGPSVITSRFCTFRAERRAGLSYCPCLSAILPLPTGTRLMLPCIRPCSSWEILNSKFFNERLEFDCYIKAAINHFPVMRQYFPCHFLTRHLSLVKFYLTIFKLSCCFFRCVHASL